MVGNAPVDEIFEGSNGHYYTDWEVTRRLHRETWQLCMHQRDPDRRLVETPDGGLLLLTPIDAGELPDWVEIRVIGDIARVVDTRQLRSRTRFHP